jgi:heme exporter protein B
MRGFLALVGRDLRLAARSGGEVLTLLLFFVLIGVVVPFAIGPDREQLGRLAPGIIWIAAFLSMLLGTDRLFRLDAEDGSLSLFRHAELSLSALVLAKMLAHWLLTALPLLLASPLLAVLLAMHEGAWARTGLALLAGTPALVGLSTVGAAVTVSLKGGGLLAPVLVTPLAVPVLIFGVGAITSEASGAALLFLLAISLVMVALSPFAAALALTAGDA